MAEGYAINLVGNVIYLSCNRYIYVILDFRKIGVSEADPEF